MKTYPKAIKTIIYTSTTLCAAVGIAVIAGAPKAVRLAAMGTICAAQIFLAVMQKSGKAEKNMAAVTALMCFIPWQESKTQQRRRCTGCFGVHWC